MANEMLNAVVTRLSPAANNSGPASNQNPGLSSGPESTSGNKPVLPQETAKESAQSSLSQDELLGVVSKLNDQFQTVQRGLSFNLDEGTGRTVIKVVDSDSGEVIRQIPSEEVLAISKQLKEFTGSSLEDSEITPGLLFSDST